MKRTFTINDTCGAWWDDAIRNVGMALGMDGKTALERWEYIEDVCTKLDVRFDVDGNIVSK